MKKETEYVAKAEEGYYEQKGAKNQIQNDKKSNKHELYFVKKI